MVKIRLQRIGKKNQPAYRIVVTDSRNPRNGRAIDTIGYYNPLKNPTEIKFEKDKLEKWVGVGAQMSDTVKRITKQK